MRKIVVAVVSVCLASVWTLSIASQDTQAPPDDYIQLIRKDLRENKKSIVAESMRLTADEATKFWPVYDQYAAALAKVNDTKSRDC